MLDTDNAKTLFTFNGVLVKAKRPFWLMVIMLWGLFAWLAGKRKPERPFSCCGINKSASPA